MTYETQTAVLQTQRTYNTYKHLFISISVTDDNHTDQMQVLTCVKAYSATRSVYVLTRFYRVATRQFGNRNQITDKQLTCVWPPRSPDFTSLNNYLWHFIKEAVYVFLSQPPVMHRRSGTRERWSRCFQRCPTFKPPDQNCVRTS